MPPSIRGIFPVDSSNEIQRFDELIIARKEEMGKDNLWDRWCDIISSSVNQCNVYEQND